MGCGVVTGEIFIFHEKDLTSIRPNDTKFGLDLDLERKMAYVDLAAGLAIHDTQQVSNCKNDQFNRH